MSKNYRFVTIVSSEEAQECESLFETQTALSNLLNILEQNKELRSELFPEKQQINKIIEEHFEAVEKYELWWDNIISKYKLEKYDTTKLTLTFETATITIKDDDLKRHNDLVQMDY